MKTFIFLLVSVFSFNVSAQTISGLDGRVKYVASNVINGSSDAVVVDNVPLVHTKQILPVDKNGRIVDRILSPQIYQVFENISQTLTESGSSVDQIIKLNVFISKTDFIAEARSAISRKFHPEKQPSVTFAVGELTHPDALISIDAISVSKSKVHRVKLSQSKSGEIASSAILPAGPVVYVSGQAVKGALAEATLGTLTQLRETLIALGLSLKDVVQIKTFLTPMSSLDIVQREFVGFFKGEAIPPLVFVEWVSTDPVIEIELIASSPHKEEKVEQIDYITPAGMVPSPVYSKVSRLNYGKKIYLSGFYGVNSGSVDSEVNSIFGKMGNVLKISGSSFNNLLKATYYITDDQFSRSLGELRPKYYDPTRPPAASKAMLKGIGLQGGGILIDMIGTIRE